MQTVTTIGLDIAKSVFQVHGVDAAGQVVIRRKLKRRYVLAFFQKLPPCLIGIEACASSHYWARELQALGHTVRLMPPAYVKPYVKRQKNDMADAEAICEAVTRANMRFVPIKTPQQQSGLVLHRTRHLCIRQQTAVINAIRAHLAEFGIVAPVGRKGVEELLRVVADENDQRVPDVVRACVAALGTQLLSLKKQILQFDRMIMAWRLMKRAGGFTTFPVSVHCWQPLWWPMLLTQGLSDQAVISLPGSAWCRSSIRAGARTGSAASANKAIVIYAAGLWPARSRSSAMPRPTVANIGHGLRHCWRGGQPRLLPSRSPTNSPGWRGP